MLDWWEQNGPPVYMSVAAYLGLYDKKKTSQKKSAKSGKSGDLNQLAAMFAGTGGMIQ